MQYAKEHNEPEKNLDQSAVKALNKHDWPGNIRELKNVIQLAAGNVVGNLITSSDLSISRSSPDIPDTMRLRDPKVEKQRIADALNITQAAKLLGISRTTLTYKIKQSGLKSDLK